MNKIVLELLTKEIVILRTELQEARAEIELRGQSVATLSNYCKEDRETIAKLQSELQLVKRDYNAIHEQLQAEQGRADDWLRLYHELRTDHEKIVKSSNELQENCEELQSEQTNLLLHRNSLQAENNKLILERDRLQTDLENQTGANNWLKNEIDKVIKNRDQLRDDTARLAKNWDDCENKLKELQKTNPKDAKALRKLQEELQDTKSKLQLAQIAYNENRKLIAERDELKARLESDQEFVRISKEESLNIRREFDRVSTERDQIQFDLNTARDIIRRMRDEMKQRGIIAVIDDSILREETK